MPVSAFFPEKWAAVAQELHKPKAIYRQLANFRAEKDMKNGDIFHRVIPSDPYVQPVTRGTDLDQQAVGGTDENLTIDQEFGTLVGIENFDEIQSSVSLMGEQMKYTMINITNVIDSSFLSETLNADQEIDASDFGGVTGTPLTLSGSNIFETMAKVKQKLGENNIELDNLYGAIDPATAFVIESQVGSKETALGDSVTRKGFTGNMMRYGGFDLFVTNNYTRSIELAMATNPSNTNTVVLTVGGTAITFTAVSSIGTTEGNFLIAGTVDGTRANLEALINAPGTTTANGVAFSTLATLRLLQTAVTATNDDTADTLTVFAKGKTLVGTETLTDATDEFTAAQAAKDLMFGQRRAVDMVVQSSPRFIKRDEPRRETVNLLVTTLWGQKSYTDGAEKMVNVRVLKS